jgi:cysteine dioxygenase
MGALFGSCPIDRSFVDTLAERAGGYTRTCAFRNPDFELLLLNWAPGAASLIHDHGGQHCWMYVVDGKLDVEDFARLDPGDVPGYAHIEGRGLRRLGAGEMDLRSGRFDLHRVSAESGTGAVSLHVYAAPLERFLVYDEVARRCETAYGVYDDVLTLAEDPLRR